MTSPSYCIPTGKYCSNSVISLDHRFFEQMCKWRHHHRIILHSHHTGVHLSLGRRGINGDILITDIGEGDSDALLCYTDLTQCCRSHETSTDIGALGNWLYPNGSAVPIAPSGNDFYRDRGLSLVRLNRRNNATSPEGLFCCVVPDATFTSVTVCANLCKLFKVIFKLI